MSVSAARSSGGRFLGWGGSLRFDPETERLFHEHHRDQNHRPVALSWLIGISIIDLFIISDCVVAPRYLTSFAIGRFGIFTPIALMAVVALWRKTRCYDLLTILPQIAAAAMLSGLIVLPADGDFRAT